jgi:hypothetical protein
MLNMQPLGSTQLFGWQLVISVQYHKKLSSCILDTMGRKSLADLYDILAHELWITPMTYGCLRHLAVEMERAITLIRRYFSTTGHGVLRLSIRPALCQSHTVLEFTLLYFPFLLTLPAPVLFSVIGGKKGKALPLPSRTVESFSSLMWVGFAAWVGRMQQWHWILNSLSDTEF